MSSFSYWFSVFGSSIILLIWAIMAADLLTCKNRTRTALISQVILLAILLLLLART